MKILETWAFHGSVLFYLLTAVWSVGYFIWDRRFRLRAVQTFLLIGFIFETLALIVRGIQEGELPIFSRFEFMILVAWALVACCLAASYLYKVRLIVPFAMPVIAILFTIISIVAHEEPAAAAAGIGPMHRLWIGGHVGVIMLSIGCFTVSLGTSLMYLIQERRLKSHSAALGWARRLPALEKLDRLNFGSIGYGHVLLTFGLLIPVVMAGGDGLAKGQDSLVIWGVIIWIVYATVLVTRVKVLLGRRMVALLTVFAALLATAAYPVIRFLFEAGPTLHQTLG